MRFISNICQLRLKFGLKLSESGYKDGNIHPTLESLLYYLCSSASLPSRDNYCIELSEEEKKVKKVMIKQLQGGNFQEINPGIHTPLVVLSVLKYYLTFLPKHLFHGINTREWSFLCDVLPRLTDTAIEQIRKTEYCKSRSENLFSLVKICRRNLSYILMITLHRMAMRSPWPNSAIAQLAQYMAPVLMHDKKDKLLDFRVRSDLVTCMKFLLQHAADIFKIRNIVMPPIFLVNDPSSAESVDEALTIFDN